MRLVVVFALVACSADPAQSPLDSARARWETGGYVAYSFVRQQSCYCPSELTREMRIFVVDNTITSATYTDDQTTVANQGALAQLTTIDGTFDEIQRAIDSNAFRITVEYDATLGWPMQVGIDYEERLADEELSLVLKDVYPLTR